MFRIADAEIAEAIVWHLWQERLPERRKLRLTDGRQLRVFCTGEPNVDSGPDFLNAELAFGPGQPIRGDVEIHVRPADWGRHGHETDPRYNAVILHVVMWNDEEDPSILKQNGQYVPTLVLSDCLTESFARLHRRYERSRSAAVRRNYPCERIVQQASESAIIRLLLEAGEARFLSKTRTLATRMTRVSPEQTLYEGLMRAAGYSKNAESFHELSRRLPLETIRTCVRGLSPSERLLAVQTLLFGVAGLLPSQGEPPCIPAAGDHPYIAALEACWTACSAVIPARPMVTTTWQFFRLRPFNFPTVRLAGLSYLIAAGLDTRLDIPFLEALEAKESACAPRKRLRTLQTIFDRLLQHDAHDYWVSHSVFGGDPHTGRSRLIGVDRRRDMMVNVILPFLYTAAGRDGRARQQAAVFKIYALHPKLPDNAVMGTMQNLLFAGAPDRRRVISSARRQQGLMHIEDQTCYRKDCGRCILCRNP